VTEVFAADDFGAQARALVEAHMLGTHAAE
jgi:hypothetical protein